MVAFAANSVLNRAALQEVQIGPLPFALIRVAAGAVTLAILAQVRTPGWLGRMTLSGVASLTLYLVAFSVAYISLDAGAGALILFAGVQVTMFAGAIISGEAGTCPSLDWRRSCIDRARLDVMAGRWGACLCGMV